MVRTNSPSDAEPWQRADRLLLPAARRMARGMLPRDARFRLYFRMLDTPGLSEMYVRSRGRLRERRIQDRTRLVIEAFPSSASTYCRQAFLLANPDLAGNDICSHTHSPRIAKRAVAAGLPCIVVARDPRDAVSSTVQRFAGIRVESAFSYYQHYYRSLLPLRGDLVVATFTSVTDDFAGLVQQVNDRYGVDFAQTAQAGVSSGRVLEDIEARSRRQHGGTVQESKISRPSASRLPADVFLQDLTGAERQAMTGAMDVYREFTGEPLRS